MRKILSLATFLLLAAARAGAVNYPPYEGTNISSGTGTATHYLSGSACIAASSGTAGTCAITLSGTQSSVGIGIASPGADLDIYAPITSPYYGIYQRSANNYSLSVSTEGHIAYYGDGLFWQGVSATNSPQWFISRSAAAQLTSPALEMVWFSSGTPNTVSPAGVNQMEWGYQSFLNQSYNIAHQEGTNSQMRDMVIGIANHTNGGANQEYNRAAITIIGPGSSIDALASMGSVMFDFFGQTTVNNVVQSDTAPINATIYKSVNIQGPGFFNSPASCFSSQWWDTQPERSDWCMYSQALDKVAGNSQFDFVQDVNAGSKIVAMSISTTAVTAATFNATTLNAATLQGPGLAVSAATLSASGSLSLTGSAVATFNTPISSTSISGTLSNSFTATALGPCVSGSTVALTLPIAGNVLVGFTGNGYSSTLAAVFNGTILMDGAYQQGASSSSGQLTVTQPVANDVDNFSFYFPILNAAAGTHNFCLSTSISTGTGNLYGAAKIWAMRLP